MTDSLDDLLETATTAARDAGRLLREHFFEARKIEFKGGLDIVTDADTLSEAHILGYLRQRHPDHAILSEEAGASEGTGTLRWIVDPLDGTTNYSHQVPQFCVSIGVEGADGVLAGAVYDPMRDELFAAARGRGATLNGAPIRVSAVTTLKRALLCTGFPYNIDQHPDGPLGLLMRFIRRAQGIRRMGSAALDLAYVAAGRFDGYFEFGLKPWDVCAGGLLVMEAGGSMTAIDGGAWSPGIGDVLASGRGLSEELLRDCSQFLADLRAAPKPP